MAEQQHTSPFDALRQIDDQANEYWSARDLAKILGYTQYNKFLKAIEKAKEACKKSGEVVENHFTHTSEMVSIGSGAKREFETVHLSRYGAYLTVQNADPDKPIVALGQTYFAYQTRRQELSDEEALAGLSNRAVKPLALAMGIEGAFLIWGRGWGECLTRSQFGSKMVA